MLEETYYKFKKNILPKIKKKEPDLQEPVIEHCDTKQVIEICSYNHYPVIDKGNEGQKQYNLQNDIYDTSELEHKFEYGIYEDVLKKEELMAELKHIDEADTESKKGREIEFQNFPLEEFSEAGKVANKWDPQLKAAANTELYELEKHAIEIDINNNADDHPSEYTDENASQFANEYSSQNEVSHMQQQIVSKKHYDENDDKRLCKTVYGPTYVPYNEDRQKLLLLQSTDMSCKDNLKLLFNLQPEGMCDSDYDSLEQETLDSETFNYSHEVNTKHVLVQVVYVGSASPLIADIKTEPYSMITYTDNGMLTGTYDITHDIPIYVDNGSMLNIMPTHFYDKAYYLHHLPKEHTVAQTIHMGNGLVKNHFWIDILVNIQGYMIQFKLLVCDTLAQTEILLSKMALEQWQTWQDYSTNTLYIKQTAIPLYAMQDVELLPEQKATIEIIADQTNDLQYKQLIQGQGIVWVWSNNSSKPL